MIEGRSVNDGAQKIASAADVERRLRPQAPNRLGGSHVWHDQGLMTPDTRSIGISYDDRASVARSELRAAACITVLHNQALSDDLTEAHSEGGPGGTRAGNLMF